MTACSRSSRPAGCRGPRPAHHAHRQRQRRAAEVEPRLLLAHLLRQGFHLTGTHTAATRPTVGVHRAVRRHASQELPRSLAVQADGHEVTTVEGLATASAPPHPGAFKDEHGLQCGFCTPGMMLAAKALLDENPDPTEDEVRWALSGNICRCTGYQNMVKLVCWRPRSSAPRPPDSETGDDVTALDEIKIGGLGASRRRVEDNRFIRGKGNYVDDIVLPGMLHMEILRSPLAHAHIRSIDVSKAWDIPGVRLVLTGEMMAARNLAWMPTLSYDTQAVLATDKVRFQGQEVACVIADDPYLAKDACEAIVVDYEPLAVIVNPRQALAEVPRRCPGRQGEPARQRHLRLGGRATRTARPRLRRRRPDLRARSALPRVTPLAARVLWLDRRLQPLDVEAHRVLTTRRPTSSGPRSRRSPSCRSR